MKKQRQAFQRPKNAKELFNLRHASLYNAIERIFEVYKQRFQIIHKRSRYDILTQIDIFFAVTALHNFIMEHKEQGELDLYMPFEINDDDDDDNDVVEADSSTSTTEGSTSTRMNAMREQMAELMWNDYQEYLSR